MVGTVREKGRLKEKQKRLAEYPSVEPERRVQWPKVEKDLLKEELEKSRKEAWAMNRIR